MLCHAVTANACSVVARSELSLYRNHVFFQEKKVCFFFWKKTWFVEANSELTVQVSVTWSAAVSSVLRFSGRPSSAEEGTLV